MNSIVRLSPVMLALSLGSFAAHAAEPGYVDIGSFKPAEGCQYVEVNLHAPLLKIASAFVGHDDPETAALVRSLNHVRVNVVGFDEATRADTTDRLHKIRHELESQGWAQMVTVQEPGKAQDVAIHVKLAADESIEGLVVTVLDASEKQIVFVNVAGNIKPEQVAAVGKGLHIDALSHLSLKRAGKGV